MHSEAEVRLLNGQIICYNEMLRINGAQFFLPQVFTQIKRLDEISAYPF